MPTASFGETTASDPHRRSVTCLLHGDEQASVTSRITNNNTIYDRGPNKYPITRIGNPTVGTVSPFFPGIGSTLFSNAGMVLEVPDNNAWNISSFNDYTAEAWVNNTSFNTFNSIFSQAATNNRAWGIIIGGGTYIRLYASVDGASDVNTDFAFAFQTNTWYHIALTKTGTLCSIYVNGTRIGQVNIPTIFNSTRPLTIGQFGNFGLATHAMSGYISNLRIVAGTNVYGTGTTLTVPTTTLTAVTNTALLTCINGIHKDYSSNNFEIFSSGVPTTSAYSPFSASVSYDTSTHGSSITFAQPDRLSTPANASNTTLTGNFTISAWVKPDLYTASSLLLIDARNTGGTATSWVFYLKAAAGAYVISFFNAADFVSTGKVALGGWQHIAVSRVGTNLLFFINGKLDSTVAFNNTTLNGATNTLIIGGKDGNASSFSGQFTDLHVVNGTAIYTSNFTLPAAPQAVVSGTTLLLNGSAPGITDLSGNNAISTVGNVSTNTIVSKYGSASLAFNGTSDYIITKANPIFNIGTNNFTIEAWVYPLAYGGTNAGASIFGTVNGSTIGYSFNLGENQSRMRLISNGTGTWTDNVVVTGATGPALNTWSHVALVRNGTSLYIFVNGILQGSSTVSAGFNLVGTTGITGIFQEGTNTRYLNGYIDDLRVTVGTARYTTNFTVPDSLPAL